MGDLRQTKKGQILEKIINSNNLYLHNQNSQAHLNPSSGSFSAIYLTFSDRSIFIDFNWGLYKDPCGYDHNPIIMKNSTIKKKLRTTNKPLTMEFQKSKLAILQKTMTDRNTFYKQPH